jgi:hypothetical protein
MSIAKQDCQSLAKSRFIGDFVVLGAVSITLTAAPRRLTAAARNRLARYFWSKFGAGMGTEAIGGLRWALIRSWSQ